MTAVPVPVLSDTGYIAPPESAIRAGVAADWNAAFGGNLNPALYTSQGQAIDSESAVIGFMNDLFLLFTNMVDPAFSSGRYQDAIARFYYLERNGPLSTVVTATLGGAYLTPIPAGSLARAADGSIYQALSSVIIPLSGTIDTEFAAVVPGPTACPAGTLSTILRAIPGWDTITNAADGTLGRDVETRADFETRRGLSVAINASAIVQAMRGEVLAVDNVLDAYVTENSKATSVSIGAVTLPPHSLYVAVTGGTDADVARAIWTKKNPGCDYYGGNTTVTVQDQDGYAIPYPSYDVTFERPAALPIYFNVTIASSALVPSDASDQIKAAIIGAFNGVAPAGSTAAQQAAIVAARARIGATVFGLRYVAPVAALGSWAIVVSLKVGTSGPGALDDVGVGINKQPTITAGNITVTFV